MNSLSVRKESAKTKGSMYYEDEALPLPHCCCFILLAVTAWFVIGILIAWSIS